MTYGSVVVPTLRALSQAYALTGDPKYGRKGCVLLARLATEYPNYGWDAADSALENRFDRTFLGPYDNHHPHYKWKQGGMITDLIWETFCLEMTALAYDGLYEYMDKDPELIAFLKGKGMPIENGADLRNYIETYIFRAAMRGLLAGWIKGNEGFHQAAALAVALVMDDYSDRHPNSKDMVDYAYHGLGHCAYMLTNGLTRDGAGHESPGYNEIKLDFIKVARLMEEVRKRRPDLFPADRYPDLFANPKAKAMFDYFIDQVTCDYAYPAVGDCAGIRTTVQRNTSRVVSPIKAENLYAVQRYGDPRQARACVNLDGAFHTGELWEPYPEAKLNELLARPESEVRRESRLLDGYGLAFLESGAWPKRHSAVLNYSSLRGHRQYDNLTLWLHARGVDLLPDLGYPATWDYRSPWDANSLTHNTVTVDETQPGHGIGGAARLFASAGGVHVITAGHNPYAGVALGRADAKPVDLYERTVVMIDVDDDRYYVVDLFAVNGGEQHDQSWHAMPVVPTCPALDWQTQAAGTLAGPDVTEFAGWTDRWGRKRAPDFPSYVTEVRRAELREPGLWRWESGLPEGDTLQLHVVPLGGPAEVIMGRGRSPVRPKLDFLLVRRQVAEGAASRFLSVLDGFQGAPVVDRVRVVSEDPVVLEVTHPDGLDEVTIRLPPGPSCTTALRPVGVRVRSRRGDAWERDVRIGQVDPAPGAGYVTSRIAAADYARQEITVPLTGPERNAFVKDRTVRIYNADRTARFRVCGVREDGQQLRLTLDQTALVAQGPVKEAAGDRVLLDAYLTFANSSIDGNTAKPGLHEFAGAWLGEEASARQVLAAASNGTVLLKPAAADIAPVALPAPGTVVSIWQYAPGDAIEAPEITTSPQP